MQTVESRDQLVLNHRRFVPIVAHKIKDTLPVHVEVNDLVSAGEMGLLEAALAFDQTRRVPFWAYAKHRIKGAMLDSLRELDPVSRDLRRHANRAEAVTRDLTAVLQRTPTEEEVATKLGFSLARWRTLRQDIYSSSDLSTKSQDPDLLIPEIRCAPGSHPDLMFQQQELCGEVNAAEQLLKPRSQELLSRYYRRGETMAHIARIFGINESRVSQIHRDALDHMRDSLKKRGIGSSDALK